LTRASSEPSRAAGRIAPLDGLRAVAVLGVIYAHVWAFVLGCPVLRLGGVDINRVLALFGTGVDLFFVISGFCMYLMYGSGQRGFSGGDFRRFVGNRFRRIAPSFYAAVLLSASLVYVHQGKFPLLDVLAHLSFVFSLLPGFGRLATSFWSLATEWHFYLFLPALLFFSRRRGFGPTLGVAMAASVAFRIAVAALHLDVPGVDLDHLILSRFVEFGWGILGARLYTSGVSPPRVLRGSAGFLLGWAVSLVGRAMMTDAALRLPHLGRYLAALSIVVLGFGYMLVVWSVVAGPSRAARLCGSRPMRWIGKLSYGLYLWHWDVGLRLVSLLAMWFGKGPASPVLYSCAMLAVLLPFSELSYRLFEAPYFKKRTQTQGELPLPASGHP
jgi:peptidoglycan/LPS O-acetylase OafA/YrhL